MNLIIWSALITGFLALILPLWTLISKKKKDENLLISVISFTFCALSLFLLILYCYFLVKNNDTTTLEDTIYGLIFGSSSVLLGTIILNFLVVFKTKKNLA